MKDAIFHSYSWGYDGTDKQYGTKVTRFTKKPIEYEASIIFRGSINNRKANLDHFLETAEQDIIQKTPGKLVVGDYYINAYVLSSSTAPYEGADWTQKDATFFCPYPFWIKEETKSFMPIAEGSQTDEFLDYEYDYQYDYSVQSGGGVIWQVDHYAPCEFLMTIFGEAADPRITINGHPYRIYTTLLANEYLQIDSRNNKIIKYLANGTQQNIYDLRAKSESVFEPITPGNIAVSWPGSYGFDLTLYLERSEPRWSTKKQHKEQYISDENGKYMITE